MVMPAENDAVTQQQQQVQQQQPVSPTEEMTSSAVDLEQDNQKSIFSIQSDLLRSFVSLLIVVDRCRPIDRVKRLARPSVCPSVSYGLVTRKPKT